MSSTDDMDARHGRMLAELAEAGMGLARSLYAATQNAPVSNHDFALLTQAFHTASRSVRQTIALELKIRHESRWPAPAKPEPAPSPPPEPRVRSEQVSWNEYERADWDEPLDEALNSGDAAAINAAIDASVARIQHGLTKAGRVLDTAGHPTTARHPGRFEGAIREPAGAAPQARPRTRGALLSTSSPLGPGFRLRAGPDDGGGKAPRPPPWRDSG
jgi:hypothetical protein